MSTGASEMVPSEVLESLSEARKAPVTANAKASITRMARKAPSTNARKLGPSEPSGNEGAVDVVEFWAGVAAVEDVFAGVDFEGVEAAPSSCVIASVFV